MCSGALHPDRFKLFQCDFDLLFKTCLQLKKLKKGCMYLELCMYLKWSISHEQTRCTAALPG